MSRMCWKYSFIVGYFLWLSAATSITGVRAAFMMTVDPSSRSCYLIRSPSDGTAIITGSFDCLDDDVEVGFFVATIKDHETGKIVYKSQSETLEGVFKLDNVAASSSYDICFHNKYPDDDPENIIDVGFMIRVQSTPRSLEDGEIGPDTERALKLINRASDIRQDWNTMLDHLGFVRSREGYHLNMNAAIMQRLSYWTYIEAFVVIGVATGQVLYWRKFFETRRYL